MRVIYTRFSIPGAVTMVCKNWDCEFMDFTVQ
jgi:hypothetical protein